MRILSLFVVMAALMTTFQSAQAQDNGSANQSTTSIFKKNQNFDNEGVELYSSNLHMKKNKIIGLGLATGGVTGLIGLNAEINIQPEDAMYIGLGTGQAYSSFNFGYKMNFEGQYLSPYTKVGFSKWFSGKSETGAARKSDVLKQVLSEKEIADNKFDVNFLTAAAGIEYNQLEGELSGVNLFGEIVLMGDFSTTKLVPTASIGAIYFY